MYETYTEVELFSATHLRVVGKEYQKWISYGAVAMIIDYTYSGGVKQITLDLVNGDVVHIEASEAKLKEVIDMWLSYDGGTKC